MRKRPFQVAAAAIAAGLTALGVVRAQQPPSSPASLPAPLPTTGTLPPPTVRPFADWSPTPAPPNYKPTQPDGAIQQTSAFLPTPPGYNQTGTLPSNLPVVPNAANPGAGSTLPLPRMDGTNPATSAGQASPAPVPLFPGSTPLPGGVLPPPMVSQDPQNKPQTIPAVPTSPSSPDTARSTVPAVPGTADAHAPVLPVAPPAAAVQPPVATTAVPTLPGTAASPALIPQPEAGTPATVPPGNDIGLPVVAATRPLAVAPAINPALPGRVIQNVVVETVCPETVVFGQEFRYELIVRNVGNVPASNVRVDDELPTGARYIGSDPPAEINGDRLSWVVGNIDANAEKRIAVRVKPSDEGEIRSRATVMLAASVDARTRVTRPRLAVGVTGNESCRAGDETIFQIKVSNSGSGPAQRMILRASLSDGLLHPQGMVIEAELSNLPPGEIKMIPLKVSAAKAGLQSCQITVVAEGSADATGKAAVNVVEPLLKVTQSGPVKCHVRAEPSYEITLSNPGTAVTEPISLFTVLPESFEFVTATENGSFVSANRAVVWKLAGLAPGGTRTVSVKLRAVVAGDGLLRTRAQAIAEAPVIGTAAASSPTVRSASRTLEAQTETAVKAEGVAAIKFEVCDLEDPVELGKEAIYEIRVTNQGTGACTNVQLVASLAEGTTFVGSTGPTQVKAQGQHLVFEPITQLPVKGEQVYRVRVRSTVTGDLRFRVQLTCDQVKSPVVKEESTSFYKE